MFTYLFTALVKYLFIPLAVILLLQHTSLGLAGASFLASLALTVCGIPWLMWLFMRLAPSIALLRGKKMLQIMIEVVILVGSIIGFWTWYFVVAGR